ncbi:MAG: tetratricopeptide repeat protein [Thermodesulfobacteriota bacterium]|nr:tetratricopeptide repeat protein [Thermodesulfobacteriota bacterium]
MIRKIFISASIILIMLIAVSCEWPTGGTPFTDNSLPRDKLEAVERLINHGNLAFEKKQYENAAIYYTKAIKELEGSENSNLVTAYYNRGLAYLKKGSYESAIRDFTKVVQLNPNDGRAYYNRGNALALINFYERAIADYSRAIAISPEKASLYYSRGLTYQEKREYYDRAIDDFKKAVTINPGDKKSYCFLGITHYKKKDYREAQKYFGKALSIDPNYAEAVMGRGQAYLRSGKIEQSLSDFKKACDMGEDTGCTMLELLTTKKSDVQEQPKGRY